jgi:hypothetical protein
MPSRVLKIKFITNLIGLLLIAMLALTFKGVDALQHPLKGAELDSDHLFINPQYNFSKLPLLPSFQINACHQTYLFLHPVNFISGMRLEHEYQNKKI